MLFIVLYSGIIILVISASEDYKYTNLSIESVSEDDSQLLRVMLRFSGLGGIQDGGLNSLGQSPPEEFGGELDGAGYLLEVELPVDGPLARDGLGLLPLVRLPGWLLVFK